jgi:L-asparaginase
MKLVIFTTGGTIDKVYFDARSEFEVGEPQIGHILREAMVSFEFEVRSLMQKDSLDMMDADRALIRAAVEHCEARHILITHGTDTMAETAAALKGITGKSIVLTGALSPGALPFDRRRVQHRHGGGRCPGRARGRVRGNERPRLRRRSRAQEPRAQPFRGSRMSWNTPAGYQ